jgi:hypothetical protein
MEISVKSRTRNEGKEEDYITIPNEDFDKADVACKAFGCIPYFAIVVDAGGTIRGFILPIAHLLEICPKRKLASGWKMSRAYIDEYSKDKQIKSFVFKTETMNWWISE